MNIEKPRERILSTAKELFFSQGYSQTGINQIIKESKVSKDTLYRYFNGKDELVLEYVKEARIDWFEKFNGYLNTLEKDKTKILSAFDFLKKSMIANDFKGCRFLNLLTDIGPTNEKVRIEIVSHKQQLKNTFISFSTGLKNSNKSINELNELGTITYLLFEASIIECKVYKSVWPIEKSITLIQKLIK